MKSKSTVKHVILIIAIFALLIFMVGFTFKSYYNAVSTDIDKIGANRITASARSLENYLLMGKDTLLITSDTIQFMLNEGESHEEILKYMSQESEKQKVIFGDYSTGIYGFIDGEYLDDLWTPPDDYVPQERDWFKSAVEADGAVSLGEPYLDEETGGMIISISKLLEDKKSVVSIDLELGHIQDIVEDTNINGKGYSFVLSDSGLVIAHAEKNEIGRDYLHDGILKNYITQILKSDNDIIKTNIDGRDCTIFTDKVTGNWHSVLVVTNIDLLEDLHTKLMINGIVAGVVILLIALAVFIAYSIINSHRAKEAESMRQLQEMANDLIQGNLKVVRLSEQVIDALSTVVDAKDKYTNGHSERVALYAKEIAERLDKNSDEIQDIYYAGLLHDVGKVSIPEDIINKPGKLTDEEFETIKNHSPQGARILATISELPALSVGAHWHHERYDGKGYPDGLAGEEIPEYARIICVADCYDAMSSNRSYRRALPQAVIRAEIEKGKGTQFDPAIADIMLQMIDEDVNYDMKEKR